MKTLTLISCKRCGKLYFAGEKKIVLTYGEEVYEIMRRVPKCAECKLAQDRSPSGRKRRV